MIDHCPYVSNPQSTNHDPAVPPPPPVFLFVTGNPFAGAVTDHQSRPAWARFVGTPLTRLNECNGNVALKGLDNHTERKPHVVK